MKAKIRKAKKCRKKESRKRGKQYPPAFPRNKNKSIEKKYNTKTYTGVMNNHKIPSIAFFPKIGIQNNSERKKEDKNKCRRERCR